MKHSMTYSKYWSNVSPKFEDFEVFSLNFKEAEDNFKVANSKNNDSMTLLQVANNT